MLPSTYTPAQSGSALSGSTISLIRCTAHTIERRPAAPALILLQDRRVLRLTDVIVDCPDTMKLAAFYSAVTGRPVKDGGDQDWAGIQFGEIELAFIRVDAYRAPQWPDSEHPKQFHLDFEVDDVEAEQSRVLAIGATLQQDSIGPDGYGWRVYTDPIGHPFCLCRNSRVTWTDQGPRWPERD
jgi:predicted enzyme related to lactoylglutathione lyase